MRLGGEAASLPCEGMAIIAKHHPVEQRQRAVTIESAISTSIGRRMPPATRLRVVPVHDRCGGGRDRPRPRVPKPGASRPKGLPSAPRPAANQSYNRPVPDSSAAAPFTRDIAG
jgi:hypothetical protein